MCEFPGPGPWPPGPNLAVLGSHFGLKIADLGALKVAKFGRFGWPFLG